MFMSEWKFKLGNWVKFADHETYDKIRNFEMDDKSKWMLNFLIADPIKRTKSGIG